MSFFQDKGYGLIVPDMLGYGGTAKPLDPEAYAPSLISKDIVDILDAGGLQQSVLIGHDLAKNNLIQSRAVFGYENFGRVTPGDFVTPEERTVQMELLRQGGLAAPLNWYKIMTTSIESDDDQVIPSENAVLKKPVFFGASLRDYVAIAATYIAATK
ncbi:hypothetical protein K435DRAFT_837481 [Dendrothele bispora CBS 962.96]|uniref:AB hydrolase-1 domain-containing protein n=1 Tax=Dendrothele bispora (strain CBS 962.96) TaxID=1314807 RepID=A0A4S8MC13_DENBC|nr:hypothetical protein K435DRAFT_837481 [Dendrothele bispora CBS 962.96]